MTREERIKAFTMRIDGHNWQEIAREIGYADCTIKNDLSACIRIPPGPRPCCIRSSEGTL